MITNAALLRLLGNRRRLVVYGDLIKWLIGMAALMMALEALGYYRSVVNYISREGAMNDFGRFYYSAQHYRTGIGMYGPSAATWSGLNSTDPRHLWNLNPPHFHFVVLPLTWLPLGWAFAAWGALSAVALARSIVIVARELEFRWTCVAVAWIVLLCLLNSTTAMNVMTGQLTYLLMAAVTAGWVAWRRGDAAASGGWLGLAASVKPFLGLVFVYWIVRRNWRAFGAGIASLLGAYTAGLLVFGIDNHLSWLGALREVHWPWITMNASINGLLQRVLVANPVVEPFVQAPDLARAGALIGSVVVIAVTIVATTRDRGPGEPDRSALLLLTGGLLAAPLGWAYYFPILLGPLAAVARSAWTSRNLTWFLLLLSIVGWVVPHFILWEWASPAGALTLASVYTWTLLAMWGAGLAAVASGLRRFDRPQLGTVIPSSANE